MFLAGSAPFHINRPRGADELSTSSGGAPAGQNLDHDPVGSGLLLHSTTSSVGHEAVVDTDSSTPSSPLRRLAASHRSQQQVATSSTVGRPPLSSTPRASQGANNSTFAAALAAANADLDAAESSSTWRQRLANRDPSAEGGTAMFGGDAGTGEASSAARTALLARDPSHYYIGSDVEALPASFGRDDSRYAR